MPERCAASQDSGEFDAGSGNYLIRRPLRHNRPVMDRSVRTRHDLAVVPANADGECQRGGRTEGDGALRYGFIRFSGQSLGGNGF